MDVFNSYLKAVEKFCLCVLHFRYKMLGKVFIHNTIASSEKSQNMSDEVTLAIVKVGPILQIMTQINFFSRPEAGFGLFVVFPDVMLANRKKNETVFVFFENGL